jgi:hypothetical protein
LCFAKFLGERELALTPDDVATDWSVVDRPAKVKALPAPAARIDALAALNERSQHAEPSRKVLAPT